MTVLHGDAIEMLKTIKSNSVGSIVTDPPYGIGFMGEKWDDLPPGLPWAKECLRVLKPGGHILAFGGSRTWHRLAVAIEDARFEIRDSIAWLYSSGFPKSLNVSRAIAKSNGEAEASRWQGWGTALKPAFEPIVVGRKPFTSSVSANIAMHNTGALNIDECRIPTTEDTRRPFGTPSNHVGQLKKLPPGELNIGSAKGRWPTNVVIDGNVADQLDKNREISKFFPTFRYQAKAPTKERIKVNGIVHPTIKPVSLMRWLINLVTPFGETVLDTFAGSGTTAEAAILEGFDYILIEREAEYLPLIDARIKRATDAR